jgi:hypothetical protein
LSLGAAFQKERIRPKMSEYARKPRVYEPKARRAAVSETLRRKGEFGNGLKSFSAGLKEG